MHFLYTQLYIIEYNLEDENVSGVLCLILGNRYVYHVDGRPKLRIGLAKKISFGGLVVSSENLTKLD
jgi:hypothetical protein